MFGSKESKIEKLIRKGKWEILSKKYLYGNKETRLMLAKECGNSNDPGVNSILTTLIRDQDPEVQLETVKSLAKTGRDHEVAQLQWLLSQVPEENKELREAVQHAIANSRGRR
ncbi:MAG: HEAT repeat domain-containing protein [Clostridiaceae bacterium]|jgi:hypothetical protein|nr:HEAT repeat domain-containing protein [Clostridiaceae bacterium]